MRLHGRPIAGLCLRHASAWSAIAGLCPDFLLQPRRNGARLGATRHACASCARFTPPEARSSSPSEGRAHAKAQKAHLRRRGRGPTRPHRAFLASAFFARLFFASPFLAAAFLAGAFVAEGFLAGAF